MYTSSFEAIKQTRNNLQEPIEFLGEKHFFRPDVLAQAIDFDVGAHFARLKGPTIEVGGPTYRYEVLLGEEPPKNMLVTNISNSSPWSRNERVGMLANASQLPFADGTIGSLFSSGLPQTAYDKNGEMIDLRQAFFHEAARCLEADGLLVLQGVTEDQLTFAGSLGFTPVRIMETEGSLPLTGEYVQWDAILMKSELDTDPGFNYSAEAVNMPPAQVVSPLGVAAMGGIGIAAPGE